MSSNEEKSMEINIDKANTEPCVGQCEENKTQEIANSLEVDASSLSQTSTEVNVKLIEDKINNSEAVPCEMEVTETQQETKSTEIETVKMEEVSEATSGTVTEVPQTNSQQKETTVEPAVDENQQKLAVDENQRTTDKSPQKEPIKETAQKEISDEKSITINEETVENDTKMETQASESKSKENQASESKSKPEILQANKPIGSLGLLNQYASSSDEDEDSSSSDDDGASADSESESDDTDDSSNNEVLGTPAVKDKDLNTLANSILNNAMARQNYREALTDSSYTDSDDSDVECIGTIPAQTIDITNDEEIQEFLESCEETTQGPMKTKGEFGIDDLPPIAELTITVPESECVELGNISGIVDTLVLVDSKPGFAAVDIDTVLFLEKGNRTLGQVFDVMGNVASPIYCVRFNTAQDIIAKNITAGLKVYVAPQTEYTNFIVLTDLMGEKGCDASWENDNEAPDGCNEFSDDEEERLNRRKQNQRQRNKNRPSETGDQVPNKVTVKTEPTAQNPKSRRPKYNYRTKHIEKPPQRFYKDNRGYANPDPNHFYQHHHHHHRMQPPHYNYSWHTATMHGMPSTSTSSQPMQSYVPPYAPPPPPSNHGHANVYPNPFAMQQQNYGGPFNLHAFPPLPPPISSIPPHHQPPQLHPPPSYNRKKSGSFHQQ